MKGYKDFIIQLSEKWSDKFKTESGLELYADRRFSIKRLANTVVEVKEIPVNYMGTIKQGDTIFIDPTVVMNQSYVKMGEQENINLIDRDKKLYKVDPSLIIMHRPKGGEWIGYGENLLMNRIKVEEKKSSSLIIMPSTENKFEDGKAIVEFSNPQLMSEDVYKDSVVLFKSKYAVDCWFFDKQYLWTKNRFLLATVKEAI